MSALRIASPQGVRYIDLGPARAVRLPGIGGHKLDPQSGMSRTDRDRANVYAAKYRDKVRKAAGA
jgi:hypothetical protein